MKTSKAPAYLMLAVAIGVEVFAATCMKLSTGFTNLPWTVACIAAFACSFFLLSKVLQRLPLALTQTTGVKRHRGYEDRPPSSPRT